MTLVPSAPIVAAIFASCLLPFFLLALSHGPLRIAAPTRRFLVAAACAVAVLVTLLILGEGGEWPDFVAAVALALGSLLAGFTLWTLVAWGFTVTMLRVVEEAGQVASADDWCRAYTGGHGIERFAVDRCALLVRFGFARPAAAEMPSLAITARGRALARAAAIGRALFGLDGS
jgi:hypothetical protein